MSALLQFKADGLWSRSKVANNVLGGIVVGLVALPRAMAFAIASGARPEQGLYTCIVAGVPTSLFGGTRVQISGPTGAFIAVLSIITALHGIAGLPIATLMAGVIFLGFGLALLSLAILTLGARHLRRVPAPLVALVALVAVTLLQKLLHLDSVATIGSAFGGILRTLPTLSKRLALIDTTAATVLADYVEVMELIAPVNVPRIVPGDVDDDQVIAAAVTAQADLIVSGDRKHLLPLGRHAGIAIVDAAEALRLVNSQ